MGPSDYERARLALIEQDPRLGALIEKVGPCRIAFRRDGDLFSALCETITSQQLSTRVADVIYGRLCAACAPAPHPTPERILALDTAALRAIGLSGAKAAYVHALADRVGHGDLSLEALDTMPAASSGCTTCARRPRRSGWSSSAPSGAPTAVWPLGTCGRGRSSGPPAAGQSPTAKDQRPRHCQFPTPNLAGFGLSEATGRWSWELGVPWELVLGPW
jgi:hypothetical protein